MEGKSEKKAGIFLTYINLAIGVIVPFMYTPVMLRLLGQAEYGLYSLSNSVISYLGLLSLGLGSAVVRYLMRYRAEKNESGFNSMAGLFLLMYSVIAVIAAVAGFGLTRFTGTLFGQGLSQAEINKLNVLLIIMSVSTAISFVSSVYTSYITCFERYIFLKILAVINTAAVPLLNLLVLYFGQGSVGLAIVGALMQGITCIGYIWYSRVKLGICPSLRNLPIAQLPDILRYSAFVLIGLVADMLYWATDKVLIGASLGTAAVAIYNVGGTFQGILQNMSSAISNVFTPEVNRYVVEKRPITDLSALVIRIGRIQYLVVSLILSGFAVFGHDFILLWAGPEYEEAYFVAMLTMIPLAVPLIQSIAFTVIKAQGKHQFRSVLYVVLAATNVVSTYLLIPVMGITGAALCTCVVFTLGHGIIMNWFYYKKIGLDIPGFWKSILKMTMVPSAMAAICMLIDIDIENLWQLLLGAGIYTCVFCVFSWLFSMNQYEKNLVKGLLKKFSLRKDR